MQFAVFVQNPQDLIERFPQWTGTTKNLAHPEQRRQFDFQQVPIDPRRRSAYRWRSRIILVFDGQQDLPAAARAVVGIQA
jgi:hypothetical protein